VLSQRTDGEGLHAAIRAAVEGFTTLAGEYRDLLVDGAGAVGGLEGKPRRSRLTSTSPHASSRCCSCCSGSVTRHSLRRLESHPHTAKFHVARSSASSPHRPYRRRWP